LKFKEICKDSCINQSAFVTQKIKEFVGGADESEVKATQIRNLVSYINSLELELKEKEGKK